MPCSTVLRLPPADNAPDPPRTAIYQRNNNGSSKLPSTTGTSMPGTYQMPENDAAISTPYKM